MDEHIRSLQRAASSGEPGAKLKYIAALAQAGALDHAFHAGRFLGESSLLSILPDDRKASGAPGYIHYLSVIGAYGRVVSVKAGAVVGWHCLEHWERVAEQGLQAPLEELSSHLRSCLEACDRWLLERSADAAYAAAIQALDAENAWNDITAAWREQHPPVRNLVRQSSEPDEPEALLGAARAIVTVPSLIGVPEERSGLVHAMFHLFVEAVHQLKMTGLELSMREGLLPWLKDLDPHSPQSPSPP